MERWLAVYGGSLNRFVAIEPLHTARAHAWICSEPLLRLCRATSTLRPAPAKFWIQQLIQGSARDPLDIQQELHRDTFHAAYKLWLFLEDVAYPVQANTLLIADVRGFHRRGRALPGAVRTAIHANLRPHPFRG